ncbi:DUF2950 family protein [Stappia sp. GBMRC 2046]|uniref:DUF2950 family protein n=1 Tax=Stappia sediminis TaxID=2692190 RepID=A0A7X3LSE4_9HYPH|nr:DUF2950 domain-containing protein [Stappia sediminis]MXN64225.1 DUF2950 family protein [Stappia sediminis]
MNTAFHRMLLVSAAMVLSGTVAVSNPAPGLAQEEPSISDFALDQDPPVFDNAEAAVEAFKKALADDDFDRVAELLGLDASKLKGDESTMEAYGEIREGAAKRVIVDEMDDRALIDIGDKLWPFPFPITKGEDGKWAFDTYAGLEEIVNRRVGENELETISTMRAYVDAQHDYAEEDRDDDGVLEFAQKLISSEGLKDGLYWEDEASPAGEFVQQAALDKAKEGEGYFGYRYRILTGQGDRIAGGNYDYVINDNMIAGFALIAWPLKYGETGVHTFMVSHHGIVYEADLGTPTEAIVKYIDRFNPDEAWEVVPE